jgi:hypothetical protein
MILDVSVETAVGLYGSSDFDDGTPSSSLFLCHDLSVSQPVIPAITAPENKTRHSTPAQPVPAVDRRVITIPPYPTRWAVSTGDPKWKGDDSRSASGEVVMEVLSEFPRIERQRLDRLAAT